MFSFQYLLFISFLSRKYCTNKFYYFLVFPLFLSNSTVCEHRDGRKRIRRELIKQLRYHRVIDASPLSSTPICTSMPSRLLSMSLKKIQLLTFDVHNVLLTVRNGAPSQYARLAREHLNLESVDENRVRANFIPAFRNLNVSHPGYGVHTSISSRQWWTMVVEQAFKDDHLSSTQLRTLSTVIYDEFAKGDMWTKHRQADHVLKELHKRKVLGVISNFDERLEPLLEEHQLRSYFQFVLTPRNCGWYKPQKEIFKQAASLANLRSNENLCHIGDDVQLDYRSALASNCQALLLAKDEQAKQKLLQEDQDIPADHVITNLEELLEIFE